MQTSRVAPSSPLAAATLALLSLAASFVPENAAEAQSLPVIDDCSAEMYQDRTAPGADRSLNWDYSFAADPERCIVVRVGQTVTWLGNFGDHPLEADKGDRANPIDNHVQGVVLFDRPGVFGFRCNFHLAMRGAVHVLPALSPVPWSGIGLKVSLIALLSALTLLAVREKRDHRAQPAHFDLHWLEPALLLVGAAFLAHVIGPARHASPDSATYLSAAEHLANGDGYVISTLNEQGKFAPLSCFAPLFSILIALDMKLLAHGVQNAMADVVLASFVLYAFACRAVVVALTPGTSRRWLPLLTILLLATSGSVTCLRGALSDLLGAALALFACSLLLRADVRGSVFPAGAMFAVAIWARWANLYFAASACLGVLLYRPSLPLYNTDSARLRAQLDALSHSKQARLLRSDELAELWWTAGLPDAFLAQAHLGLP